MSADNRRNRSHDQRKHGWRQQTLGIIIIALTIFALIVARYHRALLK